MVYIWYTSNSHGLTIWMSGHTPVATLSPPKAFALPPDPLNKLIQTQVLQETQNWCVPAQMRTICGSHAQKGVHSCCMLTKLTKAIESGFATLTTLVPCQRKIGIGVLPSHFECHKIESNCSFLLCHKIAQINLLLSLSNPNVCFPSAVAIKCNGVY